MFNVSAYLEALRANRDEFKAMIDPSFSPLATYRDVARFMVDADDFRIDQPVQDVRKADAESFEEFVASFVDSASVLGSYRGATEKQARYLAKLQWQLGERRLCDFALTKQEAGPLISSALARCALLAG